VPTNPEKPTTATVRAKLLELKSRVAKTSALTVMTNPDHVRDTAQQSAAIMGELLDLIEALCPYVDEVPND